MLPIRLISAAVAFFAIGVTSARADVLCPPEQGQIRWEDFVHRVGPFKITGSLWDRDTNGRPSTGDIFRADAVERKGRDVGSEQIWFILAGRLAKEFARTFTVQKRARTLRGQCETRFEVSGIPRFTSADRLTGYLASATSGAEKISPYEEARGAMDGWAKDLCKSGGHVSGKALGDRLFSRAKRDYRKLDRRKLRRLAGEVAHDNEVACARLDRGIFNP